MSPDLSRIFQFLQLFPPGLINDLLFTVESLAGQPWRDLNQFPFPNTIEKLEVAIITTTAPELSTASPLPQPLNIIISCIPSSWRPSMQILLRCGHWLLWTLQPFLPFLHHLRDSRPCKHQTSAPTIISPGTLLLLLALNNLLFSFNVAVLYSSPQST